MLCIETTLLEGLGMIFAIGWWAYMVWCVIKLRDRWILDDKVDQEPAYNEASRTFVHRHYDR